MGKYMSKLNTSILETFIKMVVGVTPIGEFEKYVERWQQEGLQDITREVNAWYAETTR
jgi:putative aldouronate transport system substrate-binding protein